MQTTIATKDLKEGLEKFKGLNKKFKILPVLSNALAECTNGKMVITATDLERIVKVEIPRVGGEDSTFLFPRRETEQFLHGTNGKVDIQIALPDKVSITREGMGETTFFVPKTDDFPPLKYLQSPLQWKTLDAEYFCQMLPSLVVACAREQGRPVLNCVVFTDGEMAAADGFRLVVLQDKRLDFGLGKKEALIHFETIGLLLKLFRKEKTLDIAFETAKEKEEELERVYFRAGNTTLISNLVNGTYPNYKLLIPKEGEYEVEFSAPLMEQRLRMIDPERLSNGITRFIFTKDEGGNHECSIKARAEDICDYSLRLPVKILSREGSKIAFNIAYVLDALKPFSMCHLELRGLSQPGKFTGDIKGLTIVVMPMFVQW